MKITVALIVAEAELAADLPAGAITGPDRLKAYVRERHRVIWAARQLIPNISMVVLGRALGGRDHTTVSHALRRHEALMARSDAERIASTELLDRMRAICPPGPFRPLDDLDRVLLGAVLAGSTLPEAANHAGVTSGSAAVRVSAVLHSCFMALERRAP